MLLFIKSFFVNELKARGHSPKGLSCLLRGQNSPLISRRTMHSHCYSFFSFLKFPNSSLVFSLNSMLLLQKRNVILTNFSLFELIQKNSTFKFSIFGKFLLQKIRFRFYLISVDRISILFNKKNAYIYKKYSRPLKIRNFVVISEIPYFFALSIKFPDFSDQFPRHWNIITLKNN